MATDARPRGPQPQVPEIDRSLIIAVLMVLFVMATAPGQGNAYVLEGPHILHLTAKALGRIASLEVDQELLIYPLTPDTSPTVFDERVIYLFPERFRSDILNDDIQKTHLVFANSSLTVVDGRPVEANDPFDHYQLLLRSRSRPRLMRVLNRLGVETAISSLGRVEETLVFIVGARYPDESVSQLAVDKETFLPVRLLLVDPITDQHVEIVYRNWQTLQSSVFPFQVLFFTNGQLVREIRVADVRINPSIPAETMDLEALKASLVAIDAPTSQVQKQEAMDAVKQAVENFQKKFE